jgi:6-pyruvoyltetrahydropterin/6-carboxytetrahydropterin synthase
MSDFHIRVAGDELSFAAAHFITLENGECEALHGHTFHVAAEMFGPLNTAGYVVDFVAVRRALRIILAELDHRVLLPSEHPALRLTIHDRNRVREVEVQSVDRRWIFPQDDCRLLPLANTTSELLAEYIAKCLAAAIGRPGDSSLRICVELSEGAGATAVCEFEKT